VIKLLNPFILSTCALFAAAGVNATEAEASTHKNISIKQTNKSPLFDGHCGNEEWQAATRIELPADILVLLMHDQDSLFVCAKGKAEDYTVIDLYIEHAKTGHLHNLHASAQLGERLMTDQAWSESEFWNLDGWGGFWVPYAGNEETEEGNRTRFLKGSHREIQVLRKKFTGNAWNMMVRVSAINHEGKYGAEFTFPEQASDHDASTWARFLFSD
jgi:hypothetical protein